MIDIVYILYEMRYNNKIKTNRTLQSHKVATIMEVLS